MTKKAARGTMVMMGYSRDTDYEHYVKCECGWEGWSAQMKHEYKAYGFGDDIDVEPMDFCPECGQSEEFAEAFVTCSRMCGTCPDRYLCYTILNILPVKTIALSEVRNGNY